MRRCRLPHLEIHSRIYGQLFGYVVFSGIIFHVITGLALFQLRRQRPDRPRPYRVVGYPWVPGVFVVAMTGILLNTVYERPIQSLLGGTAHEGAKRPSWNQESAPRAAKQQLASNGFAALSAK